MSKPQRQGGGSLLGSEWVVSDRRASGIQVMYSMGRSQVTQAEKNYKSLARLFSSRERRIKIILEKRGSHNASEFFNDLKAQLIGKLFCMRILGIVQILPKAQSQLKGTDLYSAMLCSSWLA